MEILQIMPDVQGTRIQSAGGIVFFNEEWMNHKLGNLPLPKVRRGINLKNSLK